MAGAHLHFLLIRGPQGCKWRALPDYGLSHTVHMRLRRWAEAGVFVRLLAALREQELTDKHLYYAGLDSTGVKAHPDGTDTPKKRAAKHRQVRCGRNTTIHIIAASELTALAFRLSGGQTHDAPDGRALLERFGKPTAKRSRW